jgi:Fe-S cluster biogenesis protein NfuA
MAHLLPPAYAVPSLLEAQMVTRERIETILARVRPYLVADGGDIELVDVIGNSAVVRLSGVCAKCPSAHMTLHLGVETALREAMPEFGSLRLA